MGIAQHCLCLSIGSKFWVNEPHQEIWRYYSNTCPVFWFINRQRTLEQTIFLVFFFFAQTILTAFASSAEKSERVRERERREKRVKKRMSNAPNVRHAEAQQFLSVFYYIVCVAIALAPERIYMPNTHTHSEFQLAFGRGKCIVKKTHFLCGASWKKNCSTLYTHKS